MLTTTSQRAKGGTTASDLSHLAAPVVETQGLVQFQQQPIQQPQQQWQDPHRHIGSAVEYTGSDVQVTYLPDGNIMVGGNEFVLNKGKPKYEDEEKSNQSFFDWVKTSGKCCWGIHFGWLCCIVSMLVIAVLLLIIGIPGIWNPVMQSQIDNNGDDLTQLTRLVHHRTDSIVSDDEGDLHVIRDLYVPGRIYGGSMVLGGPVAPPDDDDDDGSNDDDDGGSRRKRSSSMFIAGDYALRLENDMHIKFGSTIWAANTTFGDWFNLVQTVLDLVYDRELLTNRVLALENNLTNTQATIQTLNTSLTAEINKRMYFRSDWNILLPYHPNDCVKHTPLVPSNFTFWTALVSNIGAEPGVSASWEGVA